jgi:putative tryptophan/tyrosine transport system substrate-binding protein
VATDTQSKELQAAAQTLQLQLRFFNTSTPGELDAAFASAVQERVGALLLTDDTFFNNRVDQIVALAARHTVPVIYTFREFTAAGGLISYASNLADSMRQVGTYRRGYRTPRRGQLRRSIVDLVREIAGDE